MSNTHEGSNFLIGFVIGTVIGLAAGFLYAPRPGTETREMLKEKAELARDKATEVAHKIRTTAEEMQHKIQQLD